MLRKLCLVDKVALWQVFIRVLRFPPVNIIPPWISISCIIRKMNSRPIVVRSSETFSHPIGINNNLWSAVIFLYLRAYIRVATLFTACNFQTTQCVEMLLKWILSRHAHTYSNINLTVFQIKQKSIMRSKMFKIISEYWKHKDVAETPCIFIIK
jgi:hypothetical protein